MTEIRPIQETEGEEFLELLCTVFSLDLDRARSIFYTEPLFDINRKWALFEGPQMISILTTTPLEFGWGRAYGIAGVATRRDRQGEGHASKLLDKVYREALHAGEGASLLFAKETELYERNGYEPLDRVIRVPILTRQAPIEEPELPSAKVAELYDAWASVHPDRLRRDPLRWDYWKWHFRTTTPFQSGYLCAEPGVLREACYEVPEKSLPLPALTNWLGTTFMTDQLEIPLAGSPKVELYLMGKNFPTLPQMFMTDQF